MTDFSEMKTKLPASPEDQHLNNLISTLVAITATFMAICNIKDGNIVQAMAQAQAHSIDTWAYYQAKSTKQNIAENALEQMKIQLLLAPQTTRISIQEKMGEQQKKIEKYEREKAELKLKAENETAEYDRLNIHDDQFDMAEASLSISLAIYGIAALTRKKWLLTFGCGLTGLGLILGMSGFLGLQFHPDWLAKLLG